MLTSPVPLAAAASDQRGRGSKGVWLVLLLLVLVALVIVSVAVGSRLIPLETVWTVLWEPDESQDSLVIHGLRLPRTMLAIVAGTALGVAGALIMALTRNPLADPGILGVNAGAHLAVALAISLLGLFSFTQYVWFAFVGAIVATVVVYLIGSAGRSGPAPVRLTLAGVAFGAVLSGIAQPSL